jgi:DNA-binding HxlR family transcriptional regulator
MDAGQRIPHCEAALAAAFAVLGKRWTGVLIGALTEGDRGFAELSRGVGGEISDSVLSTRLTELIECGLVERLVIAGPPVGVRYHLTSTGRALIPALRELGTWAQTYLMDEPPSTQARAAG